MKFQKTLLLGALATCAGSAAIAQTKPAGNGLNILLFTADDLGHESVGCMHNGLPDLTPNLDRFARNNMQFNYAHTISPICQPSRAVLATGRYGNTSGMMGFIHLKKTMPTVMQYLRDYGYVTGILGKVDHSTPDMKYKWDFEHDYAALGCGRSPRKYYKFCQEFFEKAKSEKKPFYFMVNSHDPHRPFHNPDKKPMKGAEEPSKLFSPSDVKVPPYLPDLPGVRLEMSHYYNSIRRLDDTFGKVMQALKESGLEQKTIVMFLSDNGSAFPFAKANVYYASSRTPWFVQYPGVVKPGTVDNSHMISAIDFFPTVLDAAKIPIPAGVDGRSFLPLLKGEKQDNRDVVCKQVDYLIGGPARPMRCVEDKRYVYIFNPWSRNRAGYRNNNEGDTMKAMNQAAKTDPAIAQRVKMFRDRELEELYDLEKDSGCLNNLVKNPAYAELAEKMRQKLRVWMQKTNDPTLDMFDHRNDKAKLKTGMQGFPSKQSLMPEEQLKKNQKKGKNGKHKKGKGNKKKDKAEE